MPFSKAGWPTTDDVLTLAGTVPNVDVTAVDRRIVQAILDAVTREIQQKTRRQFIPSSAGVVRYFDGSGVGTQEIDEYVSVTAVAIVGYTGATPMAIVNYYAEDDNLYPKTRLVIHQGGPPAWGYGYYTMFPQGRENVAVTATWGYAAVVPDDIWMSHLEESAARLSALIEANPDGRVSEVTVADAIKEKYEIKLPGEAAGWHDRFLETVRYYVNPKVHRPPARKAVMI